MKAKHYYKYYKTYFSKNKENLSKIWKGIKEIINIKSKNFDQPTCILQDEKSTTNPNGISNCFNQYFTSIADDILKNANMKATNNFVNICLIQLNNLSLYMTATKIK